MNPYTLLPFKFERFDRAEILMTNEIGEFLFLPYQAFEELINYQLDIHSDTFLNLKAKHIVTETDVDSIVKMLAIKYRTRKGFLKNFTSLHMVVSTLRCNSKCIYCQVSRKDWDVNTNQFDMDQPTAKKVVDTIFESPSACIKIEFQGGESLLNFNIVRYIIEYAEKCNTLKKKDLEFVICTNLTLMTEEMLQYLKNHRVYISTSLDGPKDLHNKSRPLLCDDDGYDLLLDKIRLCREHLGVHSVSALMTTTSFNIHQFKETVDEYISQGIMSIFLRSLNPYGFAKCNQATIGYSMDVFVENYIEALNYIIELNLKGVFFVEYFAALLLTRMLTPFSTGFVDLQSPTGAVISGVIYDYNGNVYVSDEARMLAAMGDNKFLMGNVHENSYQEIFNSPFVHSVIEAGCLECLPECASCVYQPFCGADPVRNYSEQGDMTKDYHKSELCKRNKAIMKYLLTLLKQNNSKIENVLWSWITGKLPESDSNLQR